MNENLLRLMAREDFARAAPKITTEREVAKTWGKITMLLWFWAGMVIAAVIL